MNLLRKVVLNIVRTYRDAFAPGLNMVNVMRKCMFDSDFLLDVVSLFDSALSPTPN